MIIGSRRFTVSSKYHIAFMYFLDFSNTRRVQSFESYTNLAPLLSVLQRTEETFANLKRSSTELCENVELRQCEAMLTYIRNIYPYYSDNLMKPSVLNAISDVQSELSRIGDLVS